MIIQYYVEIVNHPQFRLLRDLHPQLIGELVYLRTMKDRL